MVLSPDVSSLNANKTNERGENRHQAGRIDRKYGDKVKINKICFNSFF